MRKLKKARGRFIILLGPDGAGKSSVINNLKNMPLSQKIEGVEVFHFRPHAITGKRSEYDQSVCDPHSQSSRNFVLSFIKLLYLVIDNIIGFLTIIRPLMKKNYLVIFDRYLYDILVDPKRYRHRGSKVITRVLCSLVPVPDIFIVLLAPVSIIQKRKQEVSEDETERQLKAYRALSEIYTDVEIVDSSSDVDALSIEIKKLIDRSYA